MGEFIFIIHDRGIHLYSPPPISFHVKTRYVVTFKRYELLVQRDTLATQLQQYE